MFSDTGQHDIQGLAKKYLMDELGLTQEQAREAEESIVGFFEVLLRIDKRIRNNVAEPL
jgi:hypothetical protein